MHSVLDPHSPQGRAVTSLWWAMFGAGATVWIVVVVLLFVAILHRRPTTGTGPLVVEPARARRALRGWVGVTGLILAGFLLYDFLIDRILTKHGAADLTIEVTGHQWWWQVVYDASLPSRRVVTANEIHVPVGQLVQINLRAVDVIHSFWAPALAGKRDLIPGYESSLRFRADTVGVYRGQCAEFCGLQHARMAFYVVAESPAAFAAWRNAESTPNPPPQDSLAMYGKQVFLRSGCSGCHTIAGTDASGTDAPNLSHVASRSTLAAGTLPNTRANLAGWIANPSVLKPGTKMPDVPLTGEELRSVVAYLETLR